MEARIRCDQWVSCGALDINPKCGMSVLRKQISPVSVNFKDGPMSYADF